MHALWCYTKEFLMKEFQVSKKEPLASSVVARRTRLVQCSLCGRQNNISKLLPHTVIILILVSVPPTRHNFSIEIPKRDIPYANM